MLFVVGGIVLAGLLFVAVMFNMLVSKRNMAEKAFATIDVMLKRRFDLVPNLVETVKGYASHERGTLEKLVELRAQAQKGGISDDEKIRLGIESSPAISRLMMLSESYPDLKANGNFLNLQRTLSEIEEQISAARRAYNAAVTDLNNACEMFPSNIFASMFGFGKKALFSAPESERRNQEVKF